LINYILRGLSTCYTMRDAHGRTVSKPVMLRTLRRDPKGRWPKERTCRALLYQGFRDDISHLWLLRILARLVPTGRVTHYLFDGDLLKGAMLMPEISRTEQDSEYGGGLFFFSGEVGNRRCGVVPFVYRAISRSITLMGRMWGVTHAGRREAHLLEDEMVAYVHKNIPLVSTSIDYLLRSQDIVFDQKDKFTVERLLIALGSTYRHLSVQDLRLWRIGVFAERNLVPALDFSAFTLQNGLTRMSQSIEDPVRQIQLDSTAGDILDLDWEKIVARATTVSDEQVKKVFPDLRGAPHGQE
jgi:hypothetical protein